MYACVGIYMNQGLAVLPVLALNGKDLEIFPWNYDIYHLIIIKHSFIKGAKLQAKSFNFLYAPPLDSIILLLVFVYKCLLPSCSNYHNHTTITSSLSSEFFSIQHRRHYAFCIYFRVHSYTFLLLSLTVCLCFSRNNLSNDCPLCVLCHFEYL